MNQAASVHGLAIEEPPVSPAREKGSRRLAPVEAARERLLRFHHPQQLGARVEITLRLIGGEKIGIGSFETEETARDHAHALTQELSSAREWLFFNGRFVRPDAVVSVDLNAY
jgi:hypothetical protein